MLIPSLNTVMTRLLIVAAVLVTLMFIASASFAQEGPIEYDENGTVEVITFTSTDPENGTAGAGIDWDVTGLDADDFYMDARGMLMFTSPPDFEDPTDRDDPATTGVDESAGDNSNMYQITVRATEQSTSGSDPRALSTEADYTIRVVDVNEDGTITLNRIHPEVGTMITASLTDPDGTTGTGDTDTVTWQWFVSKVTEPVATANNHWIEASGEDADDATYMPKGKRVPGTGRTLPDPNVAMDEGKVLRVRATYMDRSGQERTALAVSENTVRAEVTSDSDQAENPKNGSPGFSSTGVYTRSIVESEGKNSPVGAVVEAIDPNSEDILTYELDDDRDPDAAAMTVNVGGTDFPTDVSFFSIDDETAQISLRKGLSFEATDGRNYAGDTASTAGTYKFWVRATDPSGETAEIEVTVTATDANDAPKIKGSVAAEADGDFPDRPVAPAELTVNETADGTFTGGPDMLNRSLPGVSRNVFTADDEDVRRTATWSITGVDADVFELTSSSPDPTTGLRGPGEPIALRFKTDPDFENPTDDNLDSVYKVTLVVTDNRDATDERPLTIFVKNVQEGGKAELDEPQPTISNAVTAKVSDPDNGVAVVTWRWERATSTAATADWMVINGATTATYTPVKGKDHDDEGYYLRAIATYTDIMSHPDMSGTLLVDERTQSGTDQIPAARNPETATDNLYRVMVVSANAVRVPPDTPKEETDPQFAMDSYELSVSENAEKYSLVGYPVAVKTEAGKSFNYSLEDSVTGDEAYFMIATTTGQIRVAAMDFPDPVPASMSGEMPTGATSTDPALNYESKNTYNLIVTATDSSNDSRQAAVGVTVSLANINEAPYFDKASRDVADETVMYSEVRTNTVVPLLAVAEPDGSELDWVLIGDDAEDFEIEDLEDLDDGKDRIALRFKVQPNFESGKGSATSTDGTRTAAERAGDLYSVTVRATEMMPIGAGPAVSLGTELAFTVQVTDHDEPGNVEVRWLQPEVGTEISASLSDPDDESSPSWTWYRSKATTPNPITDPSDTDDIDLEWEIISGATDDEYTPVAADQDKFLLARVTYTDTPGGANRAAVGSSVNTVRADVSNEMNNSPDFNASEVTRSIDEDAAVGDPVGDVVDVDRNEDGDTLTYEIVQVRVGETGATLSGANTVGDPGNNGVVTADLSYFSIDNDDGQIRVARKLSAEETDGRTYTGTGATSTPGEYQVVVRATDPSGEPNNENRDDIVVKITATNVDEAPWISEGAAELSVCEVDSDDDNFVGLGLNRDANCQAVDSDDDGNTDTNNDNRYRRTEEDFVDRAVWPEPIGGPDGSLFEYSTPGDGIGRNLHFKQMYLPDYESPMDENSDNVYEVTIRVVDSDNLPGEKNVRITVTNVDEVGKVTLKPDQPNDGSPVKATLTDPDMVLSITNWEWATTTDSTLTAFPAGVDDVNVIDGAHMSEYMGQVGEFLWVRVMYRDAQSIVDDPVTVPDERNDTPGGDIDDTLDSDRVATSSTDHAVQPKRDDDDDDDNGSTGVVPFSIDVYENVPSTGYVGDPIPNLGSRTRIGGPDGATFVFAEMNDGPDSTFYDGDTDADDNFGLRDTADNTATDNDKGGQLALKPVTHLDHESKGSYVVEITTPVEAAVEQSVYRVTINVLDVNEAPSAPEELLGTPPARNTAPEFAATSTTRMVAENTAAGTAIGDPVAAMDADRGDTLSYELGGADAASFAIDAETGQLMTSAALDYETMMEYMVTVTATDSDGETDMIYVTIMVTNEGLDNKYDMDDSGDISRDEVIEAISDFVFDGSITRDDVIAVINLFLFS